MSREQQNLVGEVDKVVDWFKLNRNKPPPQITVTPKQYGAILAVANFGRAERVSKVETYRGVRIKVMRAVR